MMEVKLPDVCRLQYGFAFDSAQFSTTTGTPLVRIRDILRGYSETYTTETCSDEYIVDNGDLLIGMDGEFNIARWQGSRALLNQRVCRLIPSSKIDADYLYYFMPQALKRIENQTPFVTVKHLSAKQLNSIVIPLPALDIQHRISSVLDRASDLISLRKRQLAKLDELVKAQFVEMFHDDYPIVSANFVCSHIVDCPHSTPKYDGIALAYPSIRTSEIKNGRIDWGSMKYVDYSEYLERTKRLVPIAGDIVYAREGTYGDCVILPAGSNFCLGQRTMLFRPDSNKCTSIYLHQVLRSDPVKQQADKSNAGSTVPHVNIADAKNFKFPLPPLKLQNQYGNFVEQIDKSRLTIQQSLAKLEVLKKALMQEYFG